MELGLRIRSSLVQREPWNLILPTETGFKILRADPAGGVFSQIATGAANSTEYKTANRVDQGAPDYRYIVRAFNSFGDSASSNEACYFCAYPDEASNKPPEVYISSPANGDVVPSDFAITANAFDIDGNGTIAKVEFFQGSPKLGESAVVARRHEARLSERAQWRELSGLRDER